MIFQSGAHRRCCRTFEKSSNMKKIWQKSRNSLYSTCPRSIFRLIPEFWNVSNTYSANTIKHGRPPFEFHLLSSVLSVWYQLLFQNVKNVHWPNIVAKSVKNAMMKFIWKNVNYLANVYLILIQLEWWPDWFFNWTEEMVGMIMKWFSKAQWAKIWEN